jgi:hypothetical protein
MLLEGASITQAEKNMTEKDTEQSLILLSLCLTLTTTAFGGEYFKAEWNMTEKERE